MVQIDDINAAMAILADASSKVSHLLGQPVEVKLVKPVLPEPEVKSNLHIKSEALKVEITNIVCEQYMTNMTAVRGASRKYPLPDARKLIVYVLHKYVSGISDSAIAKIVNLDRSTIISHRNTCQSLIYSDQRMGFNYARTIKKLENYIQNK